MSSATGAKRPGMRSETIRKLIHIGSIVVPLLAWFLPRRSALVLLSVILVTAVAVEWSRVRVRWVRYHFLIRTRRILRDSERRQTAGATYMAAGYLLALLLYPRAVAVTAMLYSAVGDAAAALVGRGWGRTRTVWGKSWEGAVAGFVANVGIGLAMPGIPVLAALLGAAVAAMIEFLPLPVNDNLAIPVVGGAAVWVATVLTT